MPYPHVLLCTVFTSLKTVLLLNIVFTTLSVGVIRVMQFGLLFMLCNRRNVSGAHTAAKVLILCPLCNICGT